MKSHVKAAITCLITAIWIQHGLCDEPSTITNWTCSCFSINPGNQSYALSSNCSTSCSCSPEGSSEDRWTCNCAADKFPEIASNDHDTKCFSSCNCTSGSSINEQHDSKKHISSKVIVIIILLCVVLTTFGFLVSAVWYIFKRDKCTLQVPVFSSDRETSCNSDTNLISSRTCSDPESRIIIGSPIKTISGCFHRAFLFRSKTGSFRGTIFRFTYSELENATDNFSNSNIIGLGGTSQVYRGQIKDGRTVAVKRLKTPGGPEADFLFLTEIELLSRLHHYHVVPLLGYCSESQGKHAERLLVFEYLPNGNLRDCLDGNSGLNMDWVARVAIALGAARGLEYLHEAAAPRILHRDVKSTNILLDGNWRAKITDLGMAKRLSSDGIASCSSSPARMQGTFGYFAPEYAIVGRASLKSDVFSFGVVLLELITGRKAIHKSPNKGDESLVIWATPRLHDSRRVSLELPDPNLNGNFPEEELQIMAYLAKECLLLDPDSRPTMSEVVQILSTIAPERSLRRNISLDFFQRSSSNGGNDEQNVQHRQENQDEGRAINADNEIKQRTSDKWPARCSLPLDIECTLCAEKDGDNAVSTEYIEKLILLSSKARSWRVANDETVDLTEPRFEAFCMANVKSSL